MVMLWCNVVIIIRKITNLNGKCNSCNGSKWRRGLAIMPAWHPRCLRRLEVNTQNHFMNWLLCYGPKCFCPQRVSHCLWISFCQQLCTTTTILVQNFAELVGSSSLHMFWHKSSPVVSFSDWDIVKAQLCRELTFHSTLIKNQPTCDYY